MQQQHTCTHLWRIAAWACTQSTYDASVLCVHAYITWSFELIEGPLMSKPATYPCYALRACIMPCIFFYYNVAMRRLIPMASMFFAYAGAISQGSGTYTLQQHFLAFIVLQPRNNPISTAKHHRTAGASGGSGVWWHQHMPPCLPTMQPCHSQQATAPFAAARQRCMHRTCKQLRAHAACIAGPTLCAHADLALSGMQFRWHAHLDYHVRHHESMQVK